MMQCCTAPLVAPSVPSASPRRIRPSTRKTTAAVLAPHSTTNERHECQQRYNNARGGHRRGDALVPRASRGKKGKKKGGGGGGGVATLGEVTYVEVEPDGSDEWRLDEVAGLIRDGAVGIIPTDTKYAFVCDLESRDAVQTLYDLKGAGRSKPMSILCRGFSDIDRYTQQPFKLARQCLPGPYTFILNAGRDLPKVCLEEPGKKGGKACKARKTVGVRVSADPVCIALLARLDRPLLTSTVPVLDEDDDGVEPTQDPPTMADEFGNLGLSFVVDAGVRFNPASTVIDLTTSTPKLLRRGAGDASMWVDDEDQEEEFDEEDAWGFS